MPRGWESEDASQTLPNARRDRENLVATPGGASLSIGMARRLLQAVILMFLAIQLTGGRLWPLPLNTILWALRTQTHLYEVRWLFVAVLPASGPTCTKSYHPLRSQYTLALLRTASIYENITAPYLYESIDQLDFRHTNLYQNYRKTHLNIKSNFALVYIKRLCRKKYAMKITKKERLDHMVIDFQWYDCTKTCLEIK